MRTHTNSLMNYLNGDLRQIKCKLVYPDGDTITSVQSIDGECNFGNSISIGNTVSSSVRVICKTPSFGISEREFTLYFGVNSDTDEEWTKMGVFKTIPNSTENRMGFTTFTAYDRMYVNTNKEYKSTCTFPCSLSDILDDVCGQCGLTVPAITANPQIQEDVLSGYTIRDVIGYIAGYQGKNAYVDCDGKLVFRWFTSCEYTADGKNANVPFADEKDTTINILVCSTGDDNIMSGSGNAETELLSFNNPLMTSERLEEIKDEIKGFRFRRLDADIPVGNYLIESGDIIKVKYDEPNIQKFEYTVPAMTVSYHYDGGFSCKISSHGVPDGVMKSISARKFTDHTKFNGIQKEISHVTEQITGASGGYVRINFGDDGKTAEILILDQPNAEDAVNVWRFNKNGLGHSHNGYNGPFDDIALTADGHIIADRIAGNQISGVAIQTISDNSYLLMDKAHLMYYAHGEGDRIGDKISGLYAMYIDDHDGLMISCLPNAWIGFGVDENNSSTPKFMFKPYDWHKFWFGGNVAINGNLQVSDGAVLIKDGVYPDGTDSFIDVAAAIQNLHQRVSALEKALSGNS